MKLFSNRALAKVGGLALAMSTLSGCVDMMSTEELESLHSQIHAKLALDGAGHATGSYHKGPVTLADYASAPVGTVISTTEVSPDRTYNFNLKKGACAFDEHKHASRPYCHGHQSGFVTTTLPSGYVVPKDKQASAHIHADGTMHY